MRYYIAKVQYYIKQGINWCSAGDDEDGNSHDSLEYNSASEESSDEFTPHLGDTLSEDDETYFEEDGSAIMQAYTEE